MIPKIIHYCWFGPNEKSEIALKCIESWKRFCPDFEIKEWNEANSEVFQNKFYKDALRKKKYAFVADCVRVQALYQYGGVYLDIDMLLLKSIDDLLALRFFTGYEVVGRPAYGLFGGVPEHRFFQAMKGFYANNRFDVFSPPVITHKFSDLLRNKNLEDNEQIFEPEYFYALPYENRDVGHKQFTTDRSYAVHLWDHSWKSYKRETFGGLLKKLWMVFIDYSVYGYPSSYFQRYGREFSRKLYHRIVMKRVK